jgi:hypothetical protein
VLTLYTAIGILTLKKYGSRIKTLGFLFGNKSIGALGIWVGVQQLHIDETIATWFYQTFYGQTFVADSTSFPF